uniref:Uncharacterized protein n=1 Tax=Anopheles coluzzii TaxID=1518534 RepID=A0A8W7Q3G9_ANOCL
MPTRWGEYFVDVPHTSAYLNCAASNQAIVKVGRCARFLRVHADQLQVLPQHLQQVVQVEVHIAAHHHRERLAGQPVHLLDRDLIDLVVHVDARQIDPVAGHHVDELVLRAVLPEQDLRVENLERVQYRLYHLFVAPGQRAGRVKADATPLLDLEVDVGLALVQPQPDRLQLVLEQIPVHVRLGRVQHHQHQIGGARHRYHLPTATLALGRPLDDAGQIEQLYVGALVLDHARDAGERGELVVGRLALRLGQRGQQRRLADGREADQGDACVARLEHIEPVALLALLRRLEQLRPVLGELRLQQSQMVLAGVEIWCYFVEEMG